MPKDISHLRKRAKSIKEIAILPKRARFQSNKPNSPLFYDGTLSTKNKKICLPTITNTN
jgi:hypothetical protein